MFKRISLIECLKSASYKNTRYYFFFIKAYRLGSTFFVILAVIYFLHIIFLQTPLPEIKRETNIYSNTDTNKYIVSLNVSNVEVVNIPSVNKLRMMWIQKKLKYMSRKMENLLINKILNVKELDSPNYNLHIFYYAWFRNVKVDGFWNRWRKPGSQRKKIKMQESIDSTYYPKLGCYSSKNTTVIEQHMKMIKKAGIGVIIISWVPPPLVDSPKAFLNSILNAADANKLKVAFQILNYKSRTTMSVLKQVKFIISTYGNHSAIYRLEKNSQKLPVFYIYDTFQIPHSSWKSILSSNSHLTIRKTKFDAIFLAQLSEYHQGTLLKAANFDGFYTYSSANGLSYGSSWKNWDMLAKLANDKDLIFVPCVGPGYTSHENGVKHVRHRLHGNYYEVGWRSAIRLKPEIVAVNSFNNWQEGNQIEPARPKKTKTMVYSDYEPEGATFYLDLTLWFNRKFLEFQ